MKKPPELTRSIRAYMSFIGARAKGTKKTLTPSQRKFRAQQLEIARAKRWPDKLSKESRLMRDKARAKLRYALKTGRVQKGVCEVCNSPEVEAHHFDYSQPLVAQWFCHKHHVLIHKAARRMRF